jgi:hypothetical protein
MNFFNDLNRIPMPKLCRIDTMDHHLNDDSIEDESYDIPEIQQQQTDTDEFRPDEINVAKSIMEELGRPSPPLPIDYRPDDDIMFYAPGKLTIDINSILKNTQNIEEHDEYGLAFTKMDKIPNINRFYKDIMNSDEENSALNVDLLPDLKDTPVLKREKYEFLPWYHPTKESWANYVMTHGKNGILYTKVGALSIDSWNPDHLDVLA